MEQHELGMNENSFISIIMLLIKSIPPFCSLLKNLNLQQMYFSYRILTSLSISKCIVWTNLLWPPEKKKLSLLLVRFGWLNVHLIVLSIGNLDLMSNIIIEIKLFSFIPSSCCSILWITLTKKLRCSSWNTFVVNLSFSIMSKKGVFSDYRWKLLNVLQ
jgi:hypothetical protein